MPNSPWNSANVPGPLADDYPDEVLNGDLADALRARYGVTDPKVVTGLLARELDLEPYQIKYHWTNDLLPKLNALGQYQENAGRIAIQGDDPRRKGWTPELQDHFIATMAHEMGHAADDLHRTPAINQSAKQTRLHHTNFKDFESEFADSVNAQKQIELGIPPAPQTLGKYPWLRQVNAESSNKLASPWAGKPQSIPPDIYQKTRTSDSVEEYIRILQEQQKK